METTLSSTEKRPHRRGHQPRGTEQHTRFRARLASEMEEIRLHLGLTADEFAQALARAADKDGRCLAHQFSALQVARSLVMPCPLAARASLRESMTEAGLLIRDLPVLFDIPMGTAATYCSSHTSSIPWWLLCGVQSIAEARMAEREAAAA
jgi:hypothetical protein